MLRKIRIGLLAMQELGVQQVMLYGLYRLGLITGYFRWRTPSRKQKIPAKQLVFKPVFTLPEKDTLIELLGNQFHRLRREADEILDRQVRLFGGDPVPLVLSPKGADKHWTKTKISSGEDIKLIWEPARFGWAFTLGRAYLVSGDERYAAAFWLYWEEFTESNPVNCGPNWESGQEVALRLIAYLYALQVFSGSIHSSDERKNRMLQAVVDHAVRIPPTIIYARAQDNNHLVSEACGLYLAGASLPDHPRAASWRETGWHWLDYALRTQFDSDGTYIQHSMNYHRMVLQLALIALAGSRKEGRQLSPEVMENLAAGTRWLIAQMDAHTGDAPNLGNNDGAHILPLAGGSFRDHRPTAQAAAAAFLGKAVFPSGPWDEMSYWLGIKNSDNPDQPVTVSSPAIKRLGSIDEWATLRAVHYRSRPAHADQLHFELWFHGANILRDPGTYAYSQESPWDNSLVHSRFHNTLTIDGEDPMLRAGRFLWLQWDQARWIEEGCQLPEIVTAEHDGYDRIGFKHRRSVEWLEPGLWEVTDWVSPARKKGEHWLTIQWLVIDGQWSLDEEKLTVVGNHEKLTVAVRTNTLSDVRPIEHRLVRGGVTLIGKDAGLKSEGWYSPTYGNLEPALYYQVRFPLINPVLIETRIQLERLPQIGISG